MTELVRIFYSPVLARRLRLKYDRALAKTVKPPCLILANHTTNPDPFIIGGCFHFAINYVAADAIRRLAVVGRLIDFLISPIPIIKGSPDPAGVMKILSVLKQGGSVGMAPEGNRTYNGETVNIPSGLGKLCKLAKVPVVVVRIERGYFTSPRWGRKMRRGRMFAYAKRVITPEEISGLTVEQTDKLLKEELYYNAYEQQKADPVLFKSKKRAEYIQRALFVCPDCHGVGTITSKNERFRCTQCGMEMEYAEDCFLKPIKNCRHGFTTLLDWDKWQIDYVKKFDFSGIPDNEPIIKEDNMILYDNSRLRKRVRVMTGAVVKLYRDKLVLEGRRKRRALISEFPLAGILSLTVQGMSKVQLYLRDGRTFMFKMPPEVSPYKYMVFIYRLKANLNHEEMTYYGI